MLADSRTFQISKTKNLSLLNKHSGATHEENMHSPFDYNMDIDILFESDQFTGYLTFAEIYVSSHMLW